MTFLPLIASLLFAQPAPAAPRDAPAKKPAELAPVAFPHPLITEILYAPPKGAEGDANQDGKRNAVGDEFIELINPHDKPINLKGYVLSDGVPKAGPDAKKPTPKSGMDPRPSDDPHAKPGTTDPTPADAVDPAKRPKSSRLRFVFPDLTLKPGEVVVVFNGYESTIPGPVGDANAAAARNEKFHHAYVFSMRCTSQFQALANAGDCVLLSDPEGHAVECVVWGTSDKSPEIPGARREVAPESTGSVQRRSLAGPFVSHRDLGSRADSKPFSPGEFNLADDPAPTAAPAPTNPGKGRDSGKSKPR